MIKIQFNTHPIPILANICMLSNSSHTNSLKHHVGPETTKLQLEHLWVEIELNYTIHNFINL